MSIEFDSINYLLLFLTGIIAGFMNVVAGGGSMLTIPMMIFMGLPGNVANGTNRVAILAQNISATVNFFRKKHSNLRLSCSLALCAIPGAIVGAYYGTQVSGIAFNRIVAVIMAIALISMLVDNNNYQPQTSLSGTSRRNRYIIGHILMVFVGAFGGFIQIGVGLILMPLMYKVMKLDFVAINSHKVFIVLCYTIVSLFIFASQIEIIWVVGIALALGNAIGGWLGASATIKRGEHLIKRILYFVLVVFIIKLWFNL